MNTQQPAQNPTTAICNGNATALQTRCQTVFRYLANQTQPTPDNWHLLAPYGTHPHTSGNQTFTLADAQAISADFHNRQTTDPTAALGLPWYIGHPDHPAFGNKYLDTRAYGRIKDLAPRPDGLYALVKWSPEGEALIRSEAYHGHSVNWLARAENNTFRPTQLKSVGFTNDPNIPTAPITLPNETQHPNQLMNPETLVLLNLPADATPEAVDQAIKALIAAKLDLEQKQTQAEASQSELETEIENQKRQCAAASQAMANERATRINLELKTALRDGRITPADLPTWTTKLTANPETALIELANARPILKTTAATAGIGHRKQTNDATTQFVELCNQRMTTHRETWATAWCAVKRDNPALFESMSTPNK